MSSSTDKSGNTQNVDVDLTAAETDTQQNVSNSSAGSASGSETSLPGQSSTRPRLSGLKIHISEHKEAVHGSLEAVHGTTSHGGKPLHGERQGSIGGHDTVDSNGNIAGAHPFTSSNTGRIGTNSGARRQSRQMLPSSLQQHRRSIIHVHPEDVSNLNSYWIHPSPSTIPTTPIGVNPPPPKLQYKGEELLISEMVDGRWRIYMPRSVARRRRREQEGDGGKWWKGGKDGQMKEGDVELGGGGKGKGSTWESDHGGGAGEPGTQKSKKRKLDNDIESGFTWEWSTEGEITGDDNGSEITLVGTKTDQISTVISTRETTKSVNGFEKLIKFLFVKPTLAILTTLKRMFLPVGFPHSVHPTYARFHFWMGVESYLTSI
ncbi:hypothetical protein HDU76_003271, partial [Blyttiomyces sp. JEL0837]